MVASTGPEKTKPTSGKVSKPLMEKKRRARINQCLDELKTHLESYYSNNIRKRKLEKADILELTVKHLRSLQKLQTCTAAHSDCPDYQVGFHSCLANFNQYLLMADHMSGNDRWMLMQLSNKLVRSRRRESSCSTMDSSSPAAATHTAATTDKEPCRCDSVKVHSASIATFPQMKDTHQSTGANKESHCKALGQSPKAENVKQVDCHNFANTHQRMWRPW